MKKVKIYKITFRRYTNFSHDTVSDRTDESYSDHTTSKYLSIGSDPFLIREDEIEKYRYWGCGIESLTFVGHMLEAE